MSESTVLVERRISWVLSTLSRISKCFQKASLYIWQIEHQCYREMVKQIIIGALALKGLYISTKDCKLGLLSYYFSKPKSNTWTTLSNAYNHGCNSMLLTCFALNEQKLSCSRTGIECLYCRGSARDKDVLHKQIINTNIYYIFFSITSVVVWLRLEGAGDNVTQTAKKIVSTTTPVTTHGFDLTRWEEELGHRIIEPLNCLGWKKR